VSCVRAITMALSIAVIGGCTQQGGFANATAGTSNAYAGAGSANSSIKLPVNYKRLSDKDVCWQAIKATNPPQWEDDAGRQEYVREAQARNLTPEYCNNLWYPPAQVIQSASYPLDRDLGSKNHDIALVKEGGTFKVPVLINGVIPLDFIVDSGASDVSIPADVVLTLMRTGTLAPGDFLGTQKYRLADGSVVPSQTFRIRSLKVGDEVINNVMGSVASVEGSLLLGQSFLSRFRRVSFDYGRQMMVLE
jgi:hypothetical protein